MTRQTRLVRRFYRQPPEALARALLGQRFVRVLDGRRLAGRIVETEAYLGVPDKAAHTVGGRRTDRNASMWADGGTLYVYFTYGMHHCMNVVAGVAEDPVAVLIRALEPVEGIEQMRSRRPVARRDRDLCAGPARLCQALAIDRQYDGLDLCTSPDLFIERDKSVPDDAVVRTPRIGVDYAAEWAARPLRFCCAGHPCLSRPA